MGVLGKLRLPAGTYLHEVNEPCLNLMKTMRIKKLGWTIAAGLIVLCSLRTESAPDNNAAPSKTPMIIASSTPAHIEVGGANLFHIVQGGQTIGEGKIPDNITVPFIQDGKLQKLDQASPSRQIISGGVLLKYPWGNIYIAAKADGQNKVRLTVVMTNATRKPLLGFKELPLVDLDLPQEPGGHGWYQGNCTADSFEQVAYIPLAYGAGMGAIWLDSMDRIAQFQARHQGTKTEHKYSVSLSSAPFNDSRNEIGIAPGAKREWHLTISVAPAPTAWTDLLREPYLAFGRLHPQIYAWRDRRPIGQLVLGSTAAMHHSPTNPRGWFNEPRIDVKSPEGLAKFKELVLKNAQRDVELLKEINAQGAIVWDIEGDQYPNIQYIGDPRRVGYFAPEMDQISDQFFKVFSSAGLRTGVCLRPTEIEVHGSSLRHTSNGLDWVQLLCDRITYAKKRWGCTLFYIDSPLMYQRDYDDKVTSWLLPASVFEQVARRNPDVLLIPEHNYLDYFAAGTTYKEMTPHMFGNVFRTNELVRVAYPYAFTVIKVDTKMVVQKQSDIIQGQRCGDVLMAPCWYPAPEYAALKRLRQDARLLPMD
jgi:hypothetical protein